MKCRLCSGRISPQAGFEPATRWSAVGTARKPNLRPTTLPLFSNLTRGSYGNRQNVPRIKTEQYSKPSLARFDPGTSPLLAMYFTTALFCKLKYSDEIKIYNESILNTREDNTFSKQKQWCIKIIIYAYFCLFSASKVIMPYGKLITHWTTGGHDMFITCPAKSMHLEPFGLSVHAFCGTGDENIITHLSFSG